jgi:hypothetical protein
MITIVPVHHLPGLPVTEVLPSPSDDQLNRIRDDISIATVPDKKMALVGGHHILEHTQAEPLLGF